MPKLYTVIGGSGFIGRYVVQALAAQGYRVRVAVRHPAAAYALQCLGGVGQIQTVMADVRNPASLARAVAGADGVVNLVGILFERGARRFEAIHAQGAQAVAQAAALAGVATLVQVSALGADVGSDSAYARSKAQGEQWVQAAFPTATIVRPSVVFGAEDQFLNRFAQMATLLPFLPLIAGETRFQPVYVGDVAAAIVMALTQPGHAGKTYSLGGPRVYSMREILRYILVQIGRRKPLLPVPMALARLKALFLQFLPTPPITPDQLKLLAVDNVVPADAPGFAALALTPTPMEAIAPRYLVRYRPHGQFSPSPQPPISQPPASQPEA